MEYVLEAAAVLASLVFALWWQSPNKRFVRERGRRPKVPMYRPVKRYKSKLRGIGVAPRKKVMELGIVTNEKGEREFRYVGVDRKHYVRFYPNFGFTLFGYHWCRKGKHDGTVR